MRKLVRSLRASQLPRRVSRLDWEDATFSAFSPFFRRLSQLRANIDPFLIELRNLARILEHQEHIDLLRWCLVLQRRVLRVDRVGALAVLHTFFLNMQKSDERWLNLFETSTTLERGASVHDHVYQLFQTIDGLAEGCFKPQLQIVYAFATRDALGVWPTNVESMDFGNLVAQFPQVLRQQVPLLLTDPDVGLAVNQWRNIAAHKTFAMVGPTTIEMRSGKGTARIHRLGIHRLRGAWHWLLKTHTAVRLANTITFIEHMPELHAKGLPKFDRRIGVTLLHVSHGLSSVGFETVGWEVDLKEGMLTLRDRLAREPKGALIHASQQLIELGIGVRADVTVQNRVTFVAIRLIQADGKCFGIARVATADAEAFSMKDLSLREYIGRVEFSFAVP